MFLSYNICEKTLNENELLHTSCRKVQLCNVTLSRYKKDYERTKRQRIQT